MTLAAISDPSVHEFIQGADKTAFADMDDEGIHAPTLLFVLDLNMWTSILNSSTQNRDEGFKRIKQVHSKLVALLDQDELEKEEACRNTRSVEALLCQNNPHEAWTRDEQPNVPTVNLADCNTNAMTSSSSSKLILTKLIFCEMVVI